MGIIGSYVLWTLPPGAGTSSEIAVNCRAEEIWHMWRTIGVHGRQAALTGAACSNAVT
jgi:hypothetical protein